jgi:prolyl oligopeptidase PreP (S9A serine peptidase family)
MFSTTSPRVRSTSSPQSNASAQHLAIEGESNGGLLMGAELTQHPQMFRVVLSEVGIYDMVRAELDPNGSFNVTESGTVKDPDMFEAMYAYSPYHHVKAGVKYSAVLFITGDNDHRVNPAHSRKMTAELQAATGSGLPVMLRTNANAGHGISTNKDEALEETADIYSFLFAQLEIQMPPNPSCAGARKGRGRQTFCIWVAIGKASKSPEPPPVRRAGVSNISPGQCLHGKGSE